MGRRTETVTAMVAADAAGQANRGRGRAAGGRGRRPSQWEDEDSGDEEDDSGSGGDDFVVIGRADPASLAALQAQAKAGAAGAPPGGGAAAAGAGPKTGAAVAAAADPLDGSRFWIEASGIDDLDEEDEDEDGEEGEDGMGPDEEVEEDLPKTTEELLENMRRLGFSLADAEPPRQQQQQQQQEEGAADGKEQEAAEATPSPAASRGGGGGAALALRELQDTFIATLKAPSLPPWYLGPVEVVESAPEAAGGSHGRGARRGRARGGAGAATDTVAASQPDGAAAVTAAAAAAAAGGEPRRRGFALKVTRAVAAGELLAVSLPLAIRYCRRGTTPENEELADMMMAAGPLATAAAAGGVEGRRAKGRVEAAPAAPAGAPVNRFAGLTDLQQSLLGRLWRGHRPGAAASAAPAPASPAKDATGPGGGHGGGGPVKRQFLQLVAASAADAAAPRSPPLLSADELYRVVNLNCLGEDFQDLALCTLRGERPAGHIALWPEAAFAAHSCAPNATAYALGDRLIVRAAADLASGTAVSLNWLGSLLTSPLEVRRQELRHQYGFTCGCARCTAEASFEGGDLASFISSTYDACQSLAPALDAAIRLGDMGAVAEARERLAGWQEVLEGELRGVANTRTRKWLRASSYDLYDLISLCADELAAAAALGIPIPRPGDPPAAAGGGAATPPRPPRPPRGGGGAVEHVVETEALVQCCRILESVAPGSDPHVVLAAEAVMRCLERFGPSHDEYKQVRAAAARAYRARYGNVAPPVLEQLLAARLAAEADAAEEGEEDEEGEADEA
ncbi:hypothetical protein GPECTOR_2g1553 [Gonium pectorale]|uniref:SET domain-containing protein n=1 Tax=Gonium pectorale TaxID=33097 RepID=A0A150H1N7_GONPE|nr:hypothetical protein GPECTOR_2g1553 [Gonium pectorale]|eukprot:KXZ56001.1 hypothetical protein GPECTOR_2g1553 [Gonium pectorale]